MRLIALFVAVMLCRTVVVGAQVRFREVTAKLGVRGAWDSGHAWADFNRDGRIDVYIGYRSGRDALMLQLADGSFGLRSDAAGIEADIWTQGVSVADINNDGLPEIYVCRRDGPNLLYHNLGDGVFEDIAPAAGVAVSYNSYHAVWADYDRDGFVDLYVANFENGQENRLLRNLGNLTFEDVTYKVGNVDGGLYEKSRAAAWADFNNDGWPDLFVNNQGRDFLYRNNGDGTFTDVTEQVGLFDSGNAEGCAWGDYDNDGFLDLAVCNRADTLRLYKNVRGQRLEDVTATVGLGLVTNSVAPAWGDFDNDGFLDLFVSNAWGGTEYLFRNTGDGTFLDVTAEVGLPRSSHGNTVSWVDYDEDGDLDLFLVSYQADGPHLFENLGTAHHWLVLELEGSSSNRSAIGARATVITPGLRQIREVSGGDGFYCQQSLPLEFGLGDATQVDSLIIDWPSGRKQVLTRVPVDQYLRVVEPFGEPDVAIARVVEPHDRFVSGPFQPTVEVANRGAGPLQNVHVSCVIDSAGDTVFEASTEIAELREGQSAIVVFPLWEPWRGVRYRITFQVSALGDSDPTNNERSVWFEAVYGHDVAVLRVEQPHRFETWHWARRFSEPCAVVQNRGATTESAFDVSCEIVAEAGTVYRCVRTVYGLPPGEVQMVWFGRWYWLPGTYVVKVSTRLPTDQNPLNDVVQDTVEVSLVSGVAQSQSLADGPMLQSYPNPFNDAATIVFRSPIEGPLNLEVVDTRGRVVKRLSEGMMGPGEHRVVWDGTDSRGVPCTSGTYFLRLRRGATVVALRKVLLLR